MTNRSSNVSLAHSTKSLAQNSKTSAPKKKFNLNVNQITFNPVGAAYTVKAVCPH